MGPVESPPATGGDDLDTDEAKHLHCRYVFTDVDNTIAHGSVRCSVHTWRNPLDILLLYCVLGHFQWVNISDFIIPRDVFDILFQFCYLLAPFKSNPIHFPYYFPWF